MTATNPSPLMPPQPPHLLPVGGVRLATLAAGLRYEGRADLMLAAIPEGSSAAGALTKSLCPSAPVDWCKTILSGGSGRALVVNAGNANAFTGVLGETSARLTAVTVAAELGLSPEDVYLASTGVIGEQLPDDALTRALPELAAGLTETSSETWLAAADAIRTTDTFAKGASLTLDIDGEPVTVTGIAKGSGMIAPDMATMLAFVFTDAAVSADTLQRITSEAVENSFNRITVDSDTSTSDTVLVFATGAAGNKPVVDENSGAGSELSEAIGSVLLDLAHQVVRDGEGATKFVEVNVRGAEDPNAAKAIAMSIGNSPLVKTALAAEDANWGRIVMAVGKAGQKADRDALAIWIGPELVAVRGVQSPEYSELRATQHLKQAEVLIAVDVGVGTGEATIWTCDLTHGYIDINAGYRS